MNRLTVDEFKSSEKMPLTVVLDDVRSMYNVGSVLRSCDAFRVEAVWLCGITAVPPHPEIHKTALGAEDSVEWRYFASALDAVRELQGRGVMVMAVEQCEGSMMLDRFEPEGGQGYAVVLGNEVKGVRQDVVDACDGCLEIPQFGTLAQRVGHGRHRSLALRPGLYQGFWQPLGATSGSGLSRL